MRNIAHLENRAPEQGGNHQIGQMADLKNQASEIDRAYGEAVRSGRAAIQKALACGLMLLEAKDMVPHGEFLPWVRANTKVPVRTVQQWMKFADSAVGLLGVESLMLEQDSASPIPLYALLEDGAELPEPVIDVQARVLELIDGASQAGIIAKFEAAKNAVSKGDSDENPFAGKSDAEIKQAAATGAIQTLAESIMRITDERLAYASDVAKRSLADACRGYLDRLKEAKQAAAKGGAA